MLRSVHKLKGYQLGAIDGEIGRVKEFYFDDHSWGVRYLVADTGKWLPGRKVLISPHALGGIDDKEKLVDVRLSRRQVEESPAIDEDKPVSRQFEEKYFQYYGWPVYWQEAALWGAAPPAVPATVPTETETKIATQRGDPHLRSTTEIEGYHIQAQDGEIGHAEDFLVDDEGWVIRYLIVATRNWWPGKKVLISPLWIHEVSWEKAGVIVDVKREDIKTAPEYHPDAALDRDFEARVFEAYAKIAYWP